MPYLEGSQARIHYEQSGEGPDIVWVSGGGGTAADWDGYQIPHFRGKFRNTTFDNRGIGSTICDLPLPWTLEDFARDTAELIQAVCEPPVALVGLSLGGEGDTREKDYRLMGRLPGFEAARRLLAALRKARANA